MDPEQKIELDLMELHTYLHVFRLKHGSRCSHTSVRRKKRYFMAWDGMLFHRTPAGPKLVAPLRSCLRILRTYQDNISH